MPSLPDMYMRKMAVGPRARGRISLAQPVGDNIRAIADAFGRMVNDVTTIVLDRPRHHDLIEEIRDAGARIKLIQDGDVARVDLGGGPRHERPPRDRDRRHAAGGPLGRRAPLPRRRAAGAAVADAPRARSTDAREHGIDDIDRIFTIDDLAPQEVIVAATGVSNGDLLRGVRYLADSRADALARHVHALQLGAVRRRDPLLRARAPRGGPADLAVRKPPVSRG